MADSNPVENDFLSQITAVVEKNIANEQFGVTELANEMNMSRSNLLRKVKKLTNLSVSQLISQVRLKRGMEMMRKSTLNVSEVSHQVGFSSTSYFIKCFREYYGYPPGEVGKRDFAKDGAEINSNPVNTAALPTIIGIGARRKRNVFIWGSIGIAIVLVAALLFYYNIPSSSPSSPHEKSIAVLPFKNDSNDSTNVYLINGLMESTLNNLQKIQDLKVISRTSSEKYRNTTKSIPEMAKELKVNYFVEGSGQKIGDKILLNIQLIDANNDKHLWAKQYRREAKDIFQLQQEIAKNIAEEILAIITPEEVKRIEKIPTENLEAYDLLLKGRDAFYQSSEESMQNAVTYFKKALELDPKFALAYADVAMVFYYIDIYHTEQKYKDEIGIYADKALLYDSKSPESLVAKAMSYMVKKEFEQAVPYLEKALEYNPNSALVIHFLADLYNLYTPNSSKYLEYALLGLKLDATANDSSTTSYTYLHLSNALIQTGFVDEALTYIDKSLQYNSKNPFSGYLKAYILYAKNKDVKQTRQLLMEELKKDTTRIDVLMQVGQICYQMHDDVSAYRYFKQLIERREKYKLDLFTNENLKIGIVFAKMGHIEKSKELIASFKDYADHDPSIYKDMQLAMYYSYTRDAEKAIGHMKMFSKKDNYQYWVLLFGDDPTIEPIKDLPEFKNIMRDLETKFWANHKKIKASLEEKGLL